MASSLRRARFLSASLSLLHEAGTVTAHRASRYLPPADVVKGSCWVLGAGSRADAAMWARGLVV